MHRFRRFSVLAALLLVGVFPAGAQEPGQLPDDPLSSFDPPIPLETEEGGWYKIAPEHLPLSQLVRGLFPTIEPLLTDQSVLRGTVIKDYFGIGEGSAEEGALIRAVLAADAAKPDDAEKAQRRSRLDAVRAAEGDDAAMRAYREHLKEDSRQLGAVWGQFVADMGGPHSRAMVKIRQYLEGSRTTIGIGSNQSFSDPDHTMWFIERAFQQGIAGVSSSRREMSFRISWTTTSR